MAYSENDVPEGVRDILAYMPREMKQRVLADYESHYAPFLAMLAGWKGAVQAHYAQGEDSAIARLQEQFFPLGDWRFPCQALAVPSRPPDKTTDVVFNAEFLDPANRPWSSCGEGWILPTGLRQASVQWRDEDAILQLEADYFGGGPLDDALRLGQLVFIAAEEEAIAAMEEAEWWLQTPGGPPRRARFQRYDGYMAFEREMQTARLNQRQLDFWLPPCHPYSRKMALFYLGSDEDTTPAPDLLDWYTAPRLGFRFLGILSRPHHRVEAALRAAGTGTLFHLNAVPVIQAAVEDSLFYPPFPRAGNEYALRMSGVPNIFAAVAYNDSFTVPVSLFRLPSNDPTAKEPDVQVQFSPVQANIARVKLYHSSFGQGRGDSNETPSALQMAALRFDVPYRIVGGVTVGGPQNRAEWVRTAWYQSVLRPPLLTEGDIVEILRQRKGAFGDILGFSYATREILHQPDEGTAHWRSYLWPSIVAKEDYFDPRFGEIPAANYIPLIQSLRLAFEPGPGAAGLPEFILADVANYLASVLSQYFVVTCFRVEGRVV